jgi:hypothetical protein
MKKYIKVPTDLWENDGGLEMMTPAEKLFYLFLLTNRRTTEIGIYQFTKKEMAFYLGYSIEVVQSLLERFTEHHKVIRYNPETRELAIKNWGKYYLEKGEKHVMDHIYSQLIEVEDTSLIRFVSESIQNEEIRSMFESFCE